MGDLKSKGRRQFLGKAGAAGLGVAATTIAAPAIAQSNPEIKWRMAASWPKSLDVAFGASEMIGKRVAEMSDGKFQIQAFAAGEIVPALQVLDAVQNGTIECGHTGMYYYFGKDDAMVFATCLPFGLNARQQNAWLVQGGGLELINKFLKTYNVMMMPAGNTGTQMGGWFRKPIKTIDDLKGLKFRMGGFAGKVMQKLGVIPQQIAAGDIYPALEKGTIDAAEWVGPHDDEKLGFYKVAKFYHYPGWWEPNATTAFIVNNEKYAGLPASYKQMLKSAAIEADAWVLQRYDDDNIKALKRLVANGAVLVPFTPEIMDASYKAAHELYAEISAKNPVFKELWDSQRAYRDELNSWWQIAEYTMDSYAIRYRNAQK